MDKLELAKATFGFTADEVEIFKLAQQGADKATLQTAYALSKELEMMNATKTAMEEFAAEQKRQQEEEQKRRDDEVASMKDRAASIKDSVATPLEELEKKVKEIFSLKDFLDPETMFRQGVKRG